MSRGGEETSTETLLGHGLGEGETVDLGAVSNRGWGTFPNNS